MRALDVCRERRDLTILYGLTLVDKKSKNNIIKLGF